jgi:DNA-binding transcriptional regulator GbsR (MarR family)
MNIYEENHMIKTESEDNKISIYETKFIEVFGELYEKRGQSNFLGKLWALIFLKSKSPSNGLDQQEIAYYLNCSISTVSRNLKTLVDLHLIDFTDENSQIKNEIGYTVRKFYTRRKYYIRANFHEIIGRSLKAIIDNSSWFKNQLDSLITKMEKTSDIHLISEQHLISHIKEIDGRVDMLNKAWYQFIKESGELFSK